VTVEFVGIECDGQSARIEHAWVGSDDGKHPLIVFLHEGLGSLSMWRDFPQRLCEAAACRGLVYSRPGYGRSGARTSPLGPDFMHRQAQQVLPTLLAALGVHAGKPWLFGHSDGGSIALLHAAHWPNQVAGAIVLAPHVMVEDLTLASIAQARQAYLETDLRSKLARHHADPDSAFRGWNDIWLDPDFCDWNIEAEISAIACPLLAVQGLNDEYGSLEQIDRIARRVKGSESLVLADCGHSPHRDQPAALIKACTDFIQRHSGDPR